MPVIHLKPAGSSVKGSPPAPPPQRGLMMEFQAPNPGGFDKDALIKLLASPLLQGVLGSLLSAGLLFVCSGPRAPKGERQMGGKCGLGCKKRARPGISFSRQKSLEPDMRGQEPLQSSGHWACQESVRLQTNSTAA